MNGKEGSYWCHRGIFDKIEEDHNHLYILAGSSHLKEISCNFDSMCYISIPNSNNRKKYTKYIKGIADKRC